VAQRFTPEAVDGEPQLAHYFTQWPGADDFGFVAELDGDAVGVVWLTFFTAADPGYGYTSDDVPELGIWVRDGHRGTGVGSRLMAAAVKQARARGLPGISLSVEEGNPARHLYERLGFRPVDGRPAGTLLLRL
jgi:GNAT superfamily N-acetyltransferase